MPVYKVYFEIYGKKMVAEIEAKSEAHAERLVKDKMIFHKVEELKVDEPPQDPFNYLKNMFGI